MAADHAFSAKGPGPSSPIQQEFRRWYFRTICYFVTLIHNGSMKPKPQPPVKIETQTTTVTRAVVAGKWIFILDRKTSTQ
jgi:hypothetical protein